MGNKSTRHRSYSDAGDDTSQRRRRKPPTRSQSASQVDGRNNRLSMPELGGAVPYKPRDEVDIDVKVYRSFGDLARPKSTTLDQTDYKIYRKSADHEVQKYATLPRHFGRSKSTADVPNGGTLRDYDSRRRDVPYSPDYPEIMPRRRSPPESESSYGSQRGDSQRTSKRISAASSLSSIAKAPVSQDDFPTTGQIKRKLKCFEDQFCRSLADKYAGLADTLQLAALPIALARGQDGQCSPVKLLDYLEGETVPLDLLSLAPTHYIMLVPDALFHGIRHVRKDKISDLDLWTTLARDLVTCVAVEAANDISRMFEYQIVLLAGDSAVRVLADHAAACVLDYIKQYSSFLDRNTAVRGVVHGKPSQTLTGAPKYLSVILGNRELKWDVRDVLKRPGLRKELLLYTSTLEESDGLYSPWTYHTNNNSDPQLYGYRNVMLEWDWVNKTYRVNADDLESFGEDISDPISYPDDFHRMYSPYRLLFGTDVMMKYSQLKAHNKTNESLVQFISDSTGGGRDEIQPAYRPLVALPGNMNFSTMNLDHVDLTRAQLRRADLSQASIRHCKLLLTDLEGARFRNMDGHGSAQLKGTDVSYTNLVTSTMDQASLDEMTARHVVVVKPRPKKKKSKSNVPQDQNGQDDITNTMTVNPDTDPVALETTPVTTKPRKKRKKVPKTLNIETEIDGDTQIDVPVITNGDPENTVETEDPESPITQDTEETQSGPFISDSQGNLMEIEQAELATSKERRAVRRAKRAAKSASDIGIPNEDRTRTQVRRVKSASDESNVKETRRTGGPNNQDTRHARVHFIDTIPILSEQLIEQKQQKIRERKKKTKKRPIGPIPSTPTDTIPEMPVIVQEQVLPVQQDPRIHQPRVQSAEVSHISKQQTVYQVQQAPYLQSSDQTEEFFKESQPQYLPGQYNEPPQSKETTLESAIHATTDQETGSKGLDNNGIGDGRDISVPDQHVLEAPQIILTQAVEDTEKKPKTKKKTKKGDKAKTDKPKSGEKKRKKSRSKTPEGEIRHSASDTKDERPSDQQTTKAKPLNGSINGTENVMPPSAIHATFPAIDATPLHQKSSGKSLSATNIHQQHGAPGLPVHNSSSQEQIFYPRMTKSLSHQGNLTSTGGSKLHNLSLDSYGLGLRTARQIYGMSKEEIEFITKSQIFNLIKGLQIENIESNLPEVDELFINREQERDDLTDLLSSSGRIVTMTGCYGNGKSALANSVGHEINKKFIVSIMIDARGCASAESIALRMVETFGLHFRFKELNFFYNWINCHEQRFLFIFDNLDIPSEEDNNLSNLLDNLTRHVKDLRILCTSRRNFFKGVSTHEVYRLGNAEQFSLDILKQLLPDLHEEGLELLMDVCAHNPYTIGLVSRAFTMDDVDSGKLFEELVESFSHPLLSQLEGSLQNLTSDEGELEILRRLVVCMLKVVDNIPLGHAELLQKASHFTTSFDANNLAGVAERTDVSSVKSSVSEMKEVGLVLGAPGDRYYLSSLAKLVNQSKIDERGSDNLDYYKRTLEDLKMLCAMYHSSNCKEAVSSVGDNYDNFVHVFNKVIEREDTYEFCPGFANLEYALFLGELLPEEVYINFYESLAQESEDNNDIAKLCRSLCCLSHKLAVEESASAAKHAVDRAYDLVHINSDIVTDSERAFCLHCMGKIVWEDEKDRARALLLVKKSLDLYKSSAGARDWQTIHTNELYARMLTQKQSYQTARHFYNVSDIFVTEMANEHPLFIEGYDCRRVIWDSICLFQRSTDAAKKAVDVSKEFRGEHPVTATMLSNLCDAIIKRGNLNDAIKAGISALSIRSKVLGDHLKTGESYKKLAYLMLRSGQYDEAARFGQSALEVFEKVDASEMLQIDVRNVIAQARLRLEYKSHVFVELQGREANKKANYGNEKLNTSSSSVPVSTDV